MSKAQWLAAVTAISGGLIAVLGSLYGLGEHAAGVVSGLLFSAAMLGVNVILLTQLNVLHTDAMKRESGYNEQARGTALALQAITNVLAELAKRDALAQVLSGLANTEKDQIITTAAATAASKVADAALVAAKAVTDTALAVAREMKDGQRG